MQKCQVTVTRGQERKTFCVRQGLGFQALAARQELPIEFSCREADCGICIIRVVAGAENLSSPTATEQDFLRAMRAEADERLACQCRIKGPVEVLVEY